MKWVHDYRFLRNDMILALVESGQGAKPLSNGQVITWRLGKLFHNGYLDRPRAQLRAGRTGKMVYALGRKGAHLLSERFPGIRAHRVSWEKRNREITERHMDHTLMIANFRLALTLALEKDGRAGLSLWKDEQALGDGVVAKDGKGRKEVFPVNPDGFMRLETAAGRAYFFLEADRSTMSGKRFLRKMRGYWHYWERDACARKHDIRHFRVLTVTPTRQRRENLRSVARRADPKQKGSSLFWFACEQDFDFREPESILGPIWRTPADDEAHSMLD